MARFVQHWQGLVQVGQPWSREGTACWDFCAWLRHCGVTRGQNTLLRAPGGGLPQQRPSLTHATPAPQLHIPAGRKQPSLAPTGDNGALLLHPRCLDFCPHSLAWAITALSQFILITGGNTAWARILMLRLASQELCSLEAHGGCPIVPTQPRDILDWMLHCTGVMAHLKSQLSSRTG